MQYLLTEEEYTNLVQSARTASEEFKKEHKEIINRLCQMIADKVPLTTYPGTPDNPKPYKCVKSMYRDWYCDNCPVLDMCQMDKHFSK